MKQVGVEHLLSVGSIEAFDECILSWFSGLDVCEFYAVFFGPVDELVRDEFGSVVESNLLGQSTPFF